MKKLIIFISSLALIGSCAKVEVTEPVQDNQSNNSGALYADLPEVIYASVSDESGDDQTRTYVDGKSVKWHSGESISYYAGTYGNVKYTMTEGQPDGTVSAEFVQSGEAKYAFVEGEAYGMPKYSLAVYPYDETQKAAFNQGGYGIQVKFAKEQTYAPNSFGKGANIMVATGSSNDDANLYFRHACGYLVIKLYGTDTKVSNITLTALGESVKISGVATLRVGQNEPVRFNKFKDDEAYNTVTLDCSNGGQGVALGADDEHATEFWFALPPIMIEGGFQITVTDADGYTYTKQTTKDIQINRNEIQPMKAFAIVQAGPSSDQIWYTQAEGVTEPTTFSVAQPFDAAIKEHYYNEQKGVFVIDFEEPIKVIKANAFYENTDILDVMLPRGLETIKEYAFATSRYKSSSLRSINIPGTVTTLENNVFCYNNSLKSISFEPSPNNTPLSMGHLPGAFDECGQFWYTDMDRIEVNRAINYAHSPNLDDEGIFAGAEADEIIIGEQVTEIYDYMFTYNSAKTFVIPNSVRKIGKNAFESCSFEKVYISKNVETIDKNAFELCSSLQELVIEDSDKTLYLNKYDAISDGTIPVECGPFLDTKLRQIYIGRNVQYVNTFTPDEDDEGIFAITVELTKADPTFRTSVTIGPKVTSISYRMFANCPIGSITIPGTVNTINNRAFGGCKFLKSITFEPSTTIDSVTGKPTKLVLGYTDDTDQKSIFVDCPIEEVNIDREISYVLEANGELDQADEGIFGENETIQSVTFGPQAKSISPYMFAYSSLPSITIPNTINSVGYNAFMFCNSLTTVNIEEGSDPLTIGYQKYGGADYGPFYDSPMESINVGRDIDYRDDKGNAFTADDWDEGVFAYKHGADDYSYSEPEVQTTVTLSSNMSSISNYMFSHLTINEITIPEEIDSIGEGAFYRCNKLVDVTMNHSVPPSLGDNAFSGCSDLEHIYVPQVALTAFKSHESWDDYDRNDEVIVAVSE